MSHVPDIVQDKAFAVLEAIGIREGFLVWSDACFGRSDADIFISLLAHWAFTVLIVRFIYNNNNNFSPVNKHSRDFAALIWVK